MYTRLCEITLLNSSKKKKINNKKQKETNKRKISRNIIKTLHSSRFEICYSANTSSLRRDEYLLC